MFDTAGRATAQYATLDLRAPPLRVHGAGPANLAGGQWSWQIEQFTARDDSDLQLTLLEPAGFSISTAGVQLSRLCLLDQNAVICGSAPIWGAIARSP